MMISKNGFSIQKKSLYASHPYEPEEVFNQNHLKPQQFATISHPPHPHNCSHPMKNPNRAVEPKKINNPQRILRRYTQVLNEQEKRDKRMDGTPQNKCGKSKQKMNRSLDKSRKTNKDKQTMKEQKYLHNEKQSNKAKRGVIRYIGSVKKQNEKAVALNLEIEDIICNKKPK